MQVTAETPRVKATIAGVEVNFVKPFSKGHTCTDGEAAALNQTLKENVNNQLRGKIEKENEQRKKDGKPELSAAEVQAMVDAQVAAYEFGVRSGGGGTTGDPVKREALRMITEAIKTRLAQANVKATADEVKERATKTYEANEPQWRKAAEAEIARRQKALGALDITI